MYISDIYLGGGVAKICGLGPSEADAVLDFLEADTGEILSASIVDEVLDADFVIDDLVADGGDVLSADVTEDTFDADTCG